MTSCNLFSKAITLIWARLSVVIFAMLNKFNYICTLQSEENAIINRFFFLHLQYTQENN